METPTVDHDFSITSLDNYAQLTADGFARDQEVVVHDGFFSRYDQSGELLIYEIIDNNSKVQERRVQSHLLHPQGIQLENGDALKFTLLNGEITRVEKSDWKPAHE